MYSDVYDIVEEPNVQSIYELKTDALQFNLAIWRPSGPSAIDLLYDAITVKTRWISYSISISVTHETVE